MLNKDYPKHDMNVVFDMLSDVLAGGDCAENAIEEMNFLNRLFAALPAEAVEYGMQFLHGNKDLPTSTTEILPLYIRLVNLAEYCEKIEFLRDIPSAPSSDDIMERQKIMSSLDTHEEMFGKPLLGFRMNSSVPDKIDTENVTSDTATDTSDGEEEEQGLHLMNAAAAVFICEDPLKTALFYEQKCGFKSVHLSDESMPHIRLERDNISIVLAEGKGDAVLPIRQKSGFRYDMYVYASEPFLLQSTLQTAGVNIVEPLPDANEAVNSNINRQFVMEDCDGRYICVSQQL